jgi:cytidine deaminase
MQVPYDELLAVALTAMRGAYCPYSSFAVGAAVLAEGGLVTGGCNVENVSLGLSSCAERNAIAAAVARGMRPGELKAVLIAADAAEPPLPCGACLQFIAEFAAPECEVLCCTAAGQCQRHMLSDLLPHPFRLAR